MDQFRRDCLEAHNNYRSIHGVPPLALNRQLSGFAQQWAENLAAWSTMKHRQNSGYGENLYSSYSSNPHHQVQGNNAVDSWYDEIRMYVFGVEPKMTGTGHFTQVVWRTSTQLGVGMKKNNQGKVFVVCNYDPQGNFRGRYRQNVPSANRC